MDYQITGRLVNEIGDGLKNLLVVFYDTDRKLKIPKNLKKTVTEYLDDKGSERLGSTYSKEDGSFKFDYKYVDFAPQKEEKRPDIFVIVFTPEEKGKEVEDRVVYFSSYPLSNGGRTESIIIKLSNGILPSSGEIINGPEAKVEKIIKSFEAEESEEGVIKTYLAAKISKIQEKSNKVKNKTNEVIDKNISSIPKRLKKEDYFISNRSSLPKAQATTMKKNFELFQFNTKVPLSISLNKFDFEELGINLVANTVNEIKIPYGKYCGFINKKIGGKTLHKKKSLSEKINAAISKKDSDNNGPIIITTVTGTTETSDNKNSTVSKENQEFINDQIEGIYGPIQKTLDNSIVHANVKTMVNFDEKVSPADQKAFHDFHSLQIALENIWTEAFDEDLKDKISSAYENIVVELEQYNSEAAFISEANAILEAESLNYNKLVALFNNSSDIIGKGMKIPANILSLGIEDLDENWGALSIKQQLEVKKLSEFLVLNKDYASMDDDAKRNLLKKIVADNFYELVEDNVDVKGQRVQDYFRVGIPRKMNQFYSDTISYEEGYDVNGRRFFRAEYDINHAKDFEFKNPIKNWVEGIEIIAIEFPLSKYVNQYFLIERLNQEREIADKIQAIISNPSGIKTRVEKLLKDINRRLLEPYAFHIFAPDSVNYGILTTYRQEWVPSKWQVGDLVATMPLAPGEKRKFTKKMKIKKTRSQKEVESSLTRHTDEASYITKAHTEIFNKANTATNFNLNVTGNLGFDTGIVEGGVKTTTGYKNDQSTESSSRKKGIRESTKKAASEFKNERSIEIITKEEADFEESTSGEISNPNNEITVTYLFYELQRQFKVTENLHKLTPVILVAFDVPAPNEVDEDWLLTHEWVLRRILLDDSFHEAFDYLREGLIGDEINFEASKGHYSEQKEIVDNITKNVSSLMALRSKLQIKLNKAADNENIVNFKERKRDNERTNAFIGALVNPFQAPQSLTKFSKAGSELEGQYDSEFYEAEREALDTRINQVREELATTEEELASEMNALEKAKNQMMALTAKIYTKRNLINQLRIHVKQNILYYMQGIWEHEPPDQRFFRLYDKVAPMPKPKDIILSINDDTNRVEYYKNINVILDSVSMIYPKPDDVDFTRKIHEVADIDNLLGFKGNYAIFPLKECTYITDFMMKDYISEYLGIQDPDSDAEISTEELEKIYTQIKDNSKHKDLKDKIVEIITARKANPVIKDETIVVPTGQLFIEALPGKHALLEDFKLKHRAMDVLKVQEEVREAQIENLRRSARILNDDYEDGDIDKKINIEGTNSNLNIETD